MLTLLEGGFFSGHHEEIKSKIGELVRDGKRAYLIVPEQQTLVVEREMTDFLPPSYPLFFEVTNFTRFANTVFRSLGGLAKSGADSTKKALIMWRTLTELLPTLESYTSPEVTAGGVTKMLAAANQLRSLSITPEALLEAADTLTESGDPMLDSRLISRISDMAKITSLYRTLLTERFSDADEDILSAAKKLTEEGASSFAGAETEIFIDGFTSFTEPQYKMISVLLKHCNVTVSLTLPKSAQDAFEYKEIKEAHTRLLHTSALAGTDTRLLRTDSQEYAPTPLIADVVSLLWRSTGTVHEDFLEHSDSLRIYEAENPYEECDFVAADIKKRVMGGAKYSDFGILARSLDRYSGLLDVSFEKAGIPLFQSSGASVESYEIIKLIYSAIAAASGGFSRRDVITYAKCSLSGVPREAVDEFELYVEKWQISGDRFTDGMIWNMNPDGYTDRRSPWHEEKLLRINDAREKIIAPLRKLSEELSEKATVKARATALVEFLTYLNVEEQLRGKNDDPIAKIGCDDIGRLWKIVCDALDSLCDILGDTVCTCDTFKNLLKIVFSEANVGSIPAYTEQVVAGAADTARFYGKKYIYIIGANQGVFPAAFEDDGYFSEKDKRILSGAGLTIKDDSQMRSAREFYVFSRAISYARVGVTIVYAAQDTAFKPTPPCDAIGKIRAMTKKKISPIPLSELPASERIYVKEYALEHLEDEKGELAPVRRALESIGAGEKLRIRDGNIKNTDLTLSKEAASTLYGNTVAMTQARIDKFISCPMSYFCKYNLKLGDNRKAEFGSGNIGTFIHGVLESFFKLLRIKGRRISEVGEDEKRELLERVATEYTRAYFEGFPETSARLRHTVKKLCRAARPIVDNLCDEFSDCEYEPVFFELKIDSNNDGFPSPAIFDTGSGKHMYIYGTMDRVDTYRKDGDVYVRVVDYKTGGKDFSPEDIETGENLQMFLYLKSVVETDSAIFRDRIGAGEGGKLIPAGVIYVKASLADATIQRNDPNEALRAALGKQTRIGMLLDDADSISAMNKNYIPVKYTKNGEPDAKSRQKLYTLEGWERINETIARVMSDICERMTGGEISATPMIKKGGRAKACQYCEFKAICRNANL